MAERQAAAKQDSDTSGKHDHEHGQEPGASIPVYDTRDLLVRSDIMAKAKELANLIYTSEEVQQFRRAEKQIQGNDRIQTLISQIKKKQKEAVAFEQTFKNAAMVKKIESEMENLQDELDGIPIITEFQQSQSDINYLLQMVVSVIRDTVAEKITLDDAPEDAPENCD
ncbi:RicAFT regulatory complex protein RicA family protein [Paenibacillus beijingensis]|uniref:Membrane protein n=1 Tax=Paenibacillus beijingensis TaxID=1126833 RepID=A0A0D5NNS1_9BACL|nr:YlbF family regulator [Paenibacillus beijingensis]AJY76642.1 membrane protein [Paenibacillus beijingensis]